MLQTIFISADRTRPSLPLIGFSILWNITATEMWGHTVYAVARQRIRGRSQRQPGWDLKVQSWTSTDHRLHLYNIQQDNELLLVTTRVYASFVLYRHLPPPVVQSAIKLNMSNICLVTGLTYKLWMFEYSSFSKSTQTCIHVRHECTVTHWLRY